MGGEKEVLKGVMQLLEAARINHWRTHCGKVRVRGGFMHLAKEGVADIIGILADGSGRLFAVETKNPTDGKQRDKQKEFQKDIEKDNGVYILAKSITDIEPILKRGGR